MKRSINLYEFREAFVKADRAENFSYHGLELLFKYCEEYEESCGIEIELDVIAFCCEFSEDHWEDIASNHCIDLSDCEDDAEKIEAVREYLEYHTQLVGYVDSEESFLYAKF